MAEITTWTVRANASVLGMRRGDEATLESTLAVKNLVKRGLLERVDAKAPESAPAAPESAPSDADVSSDSDDDSGDEKPAPSKRASKRAPSKD